MHLPTGIRTTQYSVNQCNLILSRNVGLDNSHYNWKEADITEYAFENLAFLRDDIHGLAFISGGGLHEISCPGDAANSMDITLMRCFSRTVGTDGEPDGELPGLLEWDYALLPLAGESNAELVRQKIVLSAATAVLPFLPVNSSRKKVLSHSLPKIVFILPVCLPATTACSFVPPTTPAKKAPAPLSFAAR